MSKSIVKSSNFFDIDEILIVDWDIIFNSKYYLIIDIIFNTNLNKVESDYSGVSNESVLVNLYETSSTFLDSLIFVSRTQTNYDINNVLLNNNWKWVDNNKLRVVFDYVTSGFILGTGSVNKFLTIIVHNGEQTQKTITTNSINNVSGLNNREIEDFSLNSYILPTSNRLTSTNETHDMIATAVRFNNNDRILIHPLNDDTKGLLSDNINSIINQINSPIRDVNKGFVYQSSASFDFSHSFPGGLITNLIYNVNNDSIQVKFDKYSTVVDESFDPNINEIVCPIDIDWDSIVVDTTATVNTSHQVYFPVLKDFVSGDSVIVTITFSGFSTNINGINTNDTINNGLATFNLNFLTNDGSPGTDSGVIIITTNNGLNISKNVTISII